MGDGVNGTKLTGSFMNFTDGHIVAMAILSFVSGLIIFVIRNSIRKSRQ